MSTSLIIARKEVTDAFRNRYFLLILLFFMLLTGTSTVLGALKVHQDVAVYHASIALLKSMGKSSLPPMPNMNPLGVSKDFVNYTSLLGALLALVIGWDTYRKERQNKLFALILSRPVYRDQVMVGKIIGSGFVLLLITAVAGLLVYTIILMLSTAGFSSVETKKLLFFFIAVWCYLWLFASIAQFLTLTMRNSATALLTVVIIWLVFAFILPQIGDTMDLDNQIPGGFFSYLGLNKTQEQQLLTNFSWYELVRDGIEELSPTKHFERLSFALLGVKPGFADLSAFQVVGMKWVNLTVLAITPLLFTMLGTITFLQRESVE